ncbi:MAG: translation elongation factor Ts [Campylobacteraceae bacterium 4484_4]|nr:MAG: translation elongation factor Ts [Campylobacteraceae bacterium 4484_4]
MANITAAMVKELRELSGAGMMDCKKALVETEGDIDAAIELLRKKGLGKAAKKSDRLASEGLITVVISDDYKKATISEINSETDFVAKNENFINMTKKATEHMQESDVVTTEELLKTEIDGTPFEEYINIQIATIGENLVVRRFTTLKAGENGVVNGYCHSNGRVGVILAAKCDSEKTCEGARELLKNIAMHAAAMNPQYLSADQIPADVLAKEEEIAKEQLKKEGKPEKIWDKIIPGKIAKFKSDNTLLGQKFVMDDKKTVQEVIDEKAKELGGEIELVEYVRYELGEGLEKKADDFASEVAAQLK